MFKQFYLTTTIPYVNAEPHIGFALEIVHADIIARYKKLAGFDVFFNTGTDEHGIKVHRKALEVGKETQDYVDEYADKYKKLLPILGVSQGINFVRTTDPSHKKSAQEFWRRCRDNGYIYKKPYKIKYCVGCELEKTDSELEDGRCPIHPNLTLEIIEEENYFFKLSDFKDYLLELYKNTDFVIPDFRLNELRTLIREKGLEDFSISRLKSKMPWGVSVPDDEEHVMYVWFDALVNYISSIGWPEDMEKFNKWWPVVQFAGKDQVRQQATMWQAMLKAAGLPASKQIIIHGFITSGGEKMSKSLGNVVDPIAIVDEYGADALRYYLARHIHPFEDSDFTMEKFKEAYNANLANGLGNLVSRIMKMAQEHLYSANIPARLQPDRVILAGNDISRSGGRIDANDANKHKLPAEYVEALERYDIQTAANVIWGKITQMDEKIQSSQPFKLIKTDEVKAKEIIRDLVVELSDVAKMLSPILSETSEKIEWLVKENKMPEKPLFPRK